MLLAIEEAYPKNVPRQKEVSGMLMCNSLYSDGPDNRTSK